MFVAEVVCVCLVDLKVMVQHDNLYQSIFYIHNVGTPLKTRDIHPEEKSISPFH